ncbi:MAG: TRAP transporter small permease [Alphaproteobacteria bacterium]|nr:TRAP transporter small permease [Alphaproteobacteria bacterium]
MSSGSVREDGSLASRVDRGLFKFESALTLIGGITIMCVMLLSVINILGRKLFNLPIPGYIDWMVQLVPVMAFLGIAYCQRIGGHIRMDFLVGKLKGRPLWTFELVSVLLMLVITIPLIYGSWDHGMRAFNFGDSTVDINLPTWPVKILVPIMLALLGVRLLLQVWFYTRALISGEENPVAVPIPEDPETIAKREAESVSSWKGDQEYEEMNKGSR